MIITYVVTIILIACTLFLLNVYTLVYGMLFQLSISTLTANKHVPLDFFYSYFYFYSQFHFKVRTLYLLSTHDK